MKLLTIFILSLLLLQALAEASSFGTNAADSLSSDQGSDGVALYKKHHLRHGKINCNYACARRCRKTSRKKICLRACKSCCHRCKCVPPGTYGNKGACPCYASLRTHGHKLKCP